MSSERAALYAEPEPRYRARQNTLSLIRGGGHEAAISELTLFELSAKGAKYTASKTLDPDRIHRGV